LLQDNSAKRPGRVDRRAVERTNVEDRVLHHSDMRWVFATRVASSLEGGRAGILRPEVRERLLVQGQRLGLRPFDANLVIAIVQDAARTGGHALDPEVSSRLKLVRDPKRDARAPVWPLVIATLALAGAVFMFLRVWLGS